MTKPVLFERRGRAGWIVLNRPKALNALTHDMALAIDARLRAWAADDRIAAVVIEGAGDRAFCAGGDVRALYHAMRTGDRRTTRDYYRDEYRLNRRIARYGKPYIALVDGVVMGGGVGVSIHGSHRVVGDRVVFAMPETGIGLFPDVGATFFLPRMPGALGLYVGLTGARLGAADSLYAGFATHTVPSDRWGELRLSLADETGSLEARLARLATFAGPAPLAEHRAAIDRCFSGRALADVFGALERERSNWARQTLATLASKSSTSLAVTFRQIRLGASLDLESAIRLEYRLTQRFVEGWDFPEGVRAVVIDKDGQPRWRPAALADIDDAAIDALFAPMPEGDMTYED
ncbi:MAG: enoyl-CoA hydratase/isomerase family protein [Alphaproteobacteria bacterium]